MASPGKQHCANCIGALLFHMAQFSIMMIITMIMQSSIQHDTQLWSNTIILNWDNLNFHLHRGWALVPATSYCKSRSNGLIKQEYTEVSAISSMRCCPVLSPMCLPLSLISNTSDVILIASYQVDQ